VARRGEASRGSQLGEVSCIEVRRGELMHNSPRLVLISGRTVGRMDGRKRVGKAVDKAVERVSG
jgi:hypothetical protein